MSARWKTRAYDSELSEDIRRAAEARDVVGNERLSRLVAKYDRIKRSQDALRPSREEGAINSFILPVRALTPNSEFCSYCGEASFQIERDHVLARSLGGGNGSDNLVPSCRTCNSKKADKTFLAWLIEIGGVE